MKIKNIKINSYGKLKNKEINLENDFNIIYGENESGKSTLLNYIKNIFYGISKNKNGKDISDYDKYNPWVGDDFSGKISYELDDKSSYEIFRDFNKKNAKIFDDKLEDISSEFKIDKKDGSQFFSDQTGVDEKTYLSTIMSTQTEVVLDSKDQSVLVQKVANLAGTGDDEVSFKKVMDKLNKRQVEEVGNNRTQDRPLNIVQKRMKEIEVDLKDEFLHLNDKQNLVQNKNEISQKLNVEKDKNNAIRNLNMLTEKQKMNLQKNELMLKIKNENNEKIKKLKQEKEEILKNENTNFEDKKLKIENEDIKKLNSEKNKLNKKTKKLNMTYGIIFILLIIINILNFKLISNKIINYILLALIPLDIIMLIINNLKNKKEIKSIENNIKEIEEQYNLERQKQQEEYNLQKQKMQEEISKIDSQINLLETEVKKQTAEIEKIREEIDEGLKNEIEKIQKENPQIDLNEIFDLNNVEYLLSQEIQDKLKQSDEQIVNYQLDLNKMEYEEDNISNKLEEIVSLKEEQENLKEQLQIIEEKNKYIEIAKELLGKAYEKMRNSVTPKFTKELSELISKITDGKYKKVSINEESGLIVELENGEYMPASRLSIGTIDQLYLSLRLSMLNEISKEKMPIILDEAFAYFDEERLKNILLFLKEESNEHQVILLTCTKREKEILDKLSVEYNFIEI